MIMTEHEQAELRVAEPERTPVTPEDNPAELHEVAPEPEASAAKNDEPRALRRRVLGLAGPVIGENFLETLLGIVDTFLVAGLGAVALAGVGSGLQVMFFVIAALSSLSIGSAVLVAQSFGAGDLGRASRLARQSLLWSVIFSIPLAAGGVLLAGPIIGVFGLEPAVAQVGVSYLQVTMGTVVVLVALFIGGGVLRGVGNSRTPMLVTALANLVNVPLAYGMIYGHFGLPALGAVGSAWATFLARALALVLLLAALWRGSSGVSIARAGGWRPDLQVARQILRIGTPAALEQMLVSAGFFALTIVVAGLGTATLAAHRIAINACRSRSCPALALASRRRR